MDPRSSVDLTFCHTIEGAVLHCAPSVPALCAAIERTGMPQSRVEPCAVQACDFQGDIDSDDGVAVAHDNTAGTVFDPGTMEAQTELAPDPVSMPSVPAPHTAHPREQSRSPQRHVEEESFGFTSVHLSHQFGFRDSTLWCWRCGGWSAGSRRTSRLKDPYGAPTKNGADVVYRGSGGFFS